MNSPGFIVWIERSKIVQNVVYGRFFISSWRASRPHAAGQGMTLNFELNIGTGKLAQ
jgi:hypothetical protein